MNTPLPMPSLAVLSLVTALFFKPFEAFARMEYAWSAPEIIVSQVQSQPPVQATSPVLPVRNLQIELRQKRDDAVQSSGVHGQGSVILQPGNSRGSVSVGVDQSRSTQGRSLQQQALVLNGRSVSFSLGQTVPLRIVQALIYKDGLHLVPSAVLIDRNSGFSARPLWYGDDVAEVEISTMLAQGSRQTKISTTLPVQLNEWITIAQMEDSQNISSSGILSRSSENSQSSVRVEMRLTLK